MCRRHFDRRGPEASVSRSGVAAPSHGGLRQGVVRDSKSEHLLLFPPANRCPMFASRTTRSMTSTATALSTRRNSRGRSPSSTCRCCPASAAAVATCRRRMMALHPTVQLARSALWPPPTPRCCPQESITNTTVLRDDDDDTDSGRPSQPAVESQASRTGPRCHRPRRRRHDFDHRVLRLGVRTHFTTHHPLSRISSKTIFNAGDFGGLHVAGLM